MTLDIDVWTTLLTAGIFQGVVLVVILFVRHQHRIHHKLLACLLLVFVASLFDYLLLHSKLYHRLAHLALLSQPLLFVVGPLYYFFIRSTLECKFKFKALHLLHLTPTALPVVYLFPFYLLSFDEKVALLTSKQSQEILVLTQPILMGMIVHTVQILIYVRASLKLIAKDHEAPKELNERDRCLKGFGHYFSFFWMAVFATLVILSYTRSLTETTDYVIMLLATASVGVLAGMVLLKSEIWEQQYVDHSDQKKYAKSALSADQIEILAKELAEYMQTAKPFLDPKLRLTDVAHALSTSTNKLSQVLSLGFGKSFNDMVNEYRYHTFKAKLLSTDLSRITIYGIAQESGFNNKYTYIKIFKRFTDMTPSEYLRARPKSAGQPST